MAFNPDFGPRRFLYPLRLPGTVSLGCTSLFFIPTGLLGLGTSTEVTRPNSLQKASFYSPSFFLQHVRDSLLGLYTVIGPRMVTMIELSSLTCTGICPLKFRRRGIFSNFLAGLHAGPSMSDRRGCQESSLAPSLIIPASADGHQRGRCDKR